MLDSKLVGTNIARLRKQQGITQQELADKLFVTSQAVSGWERGQYLPSVDNLLDLSKLLNCELADILGETPENIDDKAALATFIGSGQAEELSDCADGEMDAYQIYGLAPFISSDKLFDMLLKCNEIPVELIYALIPFLSPEQLRKLTDKK